MYKSSNPSGLQRHQKARGFLLLLILSIFVAACGQNYGYIHWYEEARQDDGSIVMVKKLERASGGDWMSGEPGVRNYGYRDPIVEFDDPKTGETIRWDPRGGLIRDGSTNQWAAKALSVAAICSSPL